MSGAVMGLLFPAVVLLSCWHGISATVADSVPGHVPDNLTASGLHVWCGHGPAVPCCCSCVMLAQLSNYC